MALHQLRFSAWAGVAALLVWDIEPAGAFQLDWSGQFRSEAHWVLNYAMGNGALVDASRVVTNSDGSYSPSGGYYVPGGGSKSAIMHPLFMRLKPRAIVNDNIYIKSEWWVGDPAFGMFGTGVPYSADKKQFYSNQNRGAELTAQRFWAEYLSDIGTVQVGRAPLHWGYGLVWNSGDGLWDRYASTGDTIRMVSKFGSFTLVPGFSKMSQGNAFGGNCSVTGNGCRFPVDGTSGVADYSIALRYLNPDEELEAGVQWVKRIAGAAQDNGGGYLTNAGTAGGMNYNIWDIYGRKRIWKIQFGAEAPITSGDVAGLRYSTFAFASEADWQVIDPFKIGLRAGHAPGQTSGVADRFRAFFFNPNYRIAMIMFNYNLAGFAGPSTLNNPSTSPGALKSPYDNPIANSDYLALNGAFELGKWEFTTAWTFAKAEKTAKAGQSFYNYWERKFYPAAATDQSSWMGWETDLGVSYKWDEGFRFGWMGGVFLPGDYYAFSNTATANATSAVWAMLLRAGVEF